MMMPKPSLFAEEERGNRCERLGDPLAGLTKHVDFTPLAATGEPIQMHARSLDFLLGRVVHYSSRRRDRGRLIFQMLLINQLTIRASFVSK